MLPRIRRETPVRRDARIRKHISRARACWSKWPGHRAEGDLCQAGEKGWGTVAQLTKAVATLRGWEHYYHVAAQEAVPALAREMPQQAEQIYRGLRADEGLHSNFYEVHSGHGGASYARSDVRPLLEILWQLLPDEYTNGVRLADSAEQA